MEEEHGAARDHLGFADKGMNAETRAGAEVGLLKPELSPGQVINQRYRIESVLGRGGMGVVYRVRHLSFKRDFALKTLDKSQITDVAWRRFQQEAKAASQLDHPNLVRVIELDVLEDNQPYLVMDLVEGTTLAKRIQNQGPLSPEEAIPLFVQVCFGLAYAHEKGIVHRDLKPSNIMLVDAAGPSGNTAVKIVDFGIAKLLRAEEGEVQGLTRTGEIFGSPLYMSPEQCLGVAVDHRSDIYSVGCVLFEALCGLPPFLGDTALSTMLKHQSEKPPTLKEATLGKEFSPEMERVIAQLLEKDPARRYQSLRALALDLSKIQQEKDAHHEELTVNLERTQKAISRKMVPLSYAIVSSVISGLAMILSTSVFYSLNFKPQSGPAAPTRDAFGPIAHNQSVLPSYDPDSEPFSRLQVKPDGMRTRHFYFPEKLGYYSLYPGPSKRSSLSGRVDVPDGVSLSVTLNTEAVKDPMLLKRFRPDEISVLSFAKNRSLVDPGLFYLPSLKKLISLELGQTSVTNECLQFVDKLPSLKYLSVTDTDITGDGLGKMQRLGQLQSLSCKHMRDATRLLESLRGSTELKLLVIGGANLTDEDFRMIATLPNLRALSADYNPALTDAGLKHLVALKHLHTLRVQGCGITAKSAATFLSMPALISLGVSQGLLKANDVARLKADRPNFDLQKFANEDSGDITPDVKQEVEDYIERHGGNTF
ncbi:MAG TPA: protein kinase [Candidatus Obscuribacterales bacterium]